MIQKTVRLSFVIILFGVFGFTGFIGCTKKKKSESSGASSSESTAKLEPVVISSPVSSLEIKPYVSTSQSVNVSGTCHAGATVTVSGDVDDTIDCVDGLFSIDLEISGDGTFNYSFVQSTNPSDASFPVTLQWIKDSTPPSAPNLTSPYNNPLNSNSDAVVLAGICETGTIVTISGDLSSSTNCVDSSFSFDLNKSENGTYSYSVNQTDIANNASQSSNFVWTRDTIAPSAPTVSFPLSNPYISSDTDFTLTGSCEDKALVNLIGGSTNSTTCSNGAYSFPISKSVDDTYNFSISQTDSAGNVSASKSFQWIRDISIPDTPRITQPSAPSDSLTYYSNLSELIISGTDCGNGNSLLLFEETATSSTLVSSTTCSSNSFSFNKITKATDASYKFSVKQKNLAGTESSGATALTWVRDVIKPQPPTIDSPNPSSPYYSNNALSISGKCETNAIVNLNIKSPETKIDFTICKNENYTFSVSKAANGDFEYSVNQVDLAGNFSEGNPSMIWHFDILKPDPPTITNHTSPFISKYDTLTLSGVCEINAAVNVSGDLSGSATCVTGSYSITLNPSTSSLINGNYSLIISQTDLSGNTSSDTQFLWTRDTSVNPPTIASPTASVSYTSANNDLTISGSCESGATVNLSLTGSNVGSSSCVSGNFTISYSANSDLSDSSTTRNFTLNQIDLAENVSSDIAFEWVHDLSIPITPSITSLNSNPTYSNPMHSNGNQLLIEGTCTSSYLVSISGASSDSTTCSNGNFTFTVSASASGSSGDGSYSYSLSQKNLTTEVSSGGINLTWVRDTQAPTNLSVTNSSPLYSNSTTISVSGACEIGANVSINLNGGNSTNTTCSSGNYSFNLDVTAFSEGNINYTVTQSDLAGNTSNTISKIWVKDTVQPASPTVTSPDTSNTYIYVSGDENLTLTGACEVNSTVTISGDTLTTNKICSALGFYEFTVNAEITDKLYTFYLKQKDLANNDSSSQTFLWYRDSSTPSAPSVSSNLTVVSPSLYRSNTSSITITATCDQLLGPDKAILTLSGDVTSTEVTSPTGALSQECSPSGSVSFVISKSLDSSESNPYTFSITQTNPNLSLSSAATSIQWIKDTVAPNSPTIITPAVSPYTSPDNNLMISGNCEANATVTLNETISGSAVYLNSQTCSASNDYNFSVGKTDGTYTFEVKQTDLANNTSLSSLQTWVRDATMIASPTIAAPSASTSYSKITSGSVSLTLSGTCITGYTVRLSEEGSTAVVDQTCSSSSYSFLISKTVDGIYKLYVKQIIDPGANERYSALVGPKTWVVDSLAPVTTITGQNPNISSTSATFNFTASDPGSSGVKSYQCRLDTGSWGSCSSPKTYSSLANGSHTFYVKATDNAGNIEVEKSFAWNQAYYNTVALYHLNNSSPTTDSGRFTSLFTNTLSTIGSMTNDTTGRFPLASPSSSNFGSGSNYYSTASNDSLNLGLKTLTIEGFVKFSNLTTITDNYYTLVSKTGNASPDFGWDLRLRKSSSAGQFYLDFVASSNGTTAGTATPSPASFGVSVNTWYYFAITYNAGALKFFFSSSAPNTLISRLANTTVTIAATSLASTSAPLRIGANATSGTGSSLFLTGSLDEIRFSQIARDASNKIRIPPNEITNPD